MVLARGGVRLNSILFVIFRTLRNSYSWYWNRAGRPSGEAKSFDGPSFDGPSFDGPSFDGPSFDVPSFVV